LQIRHLGRVPAAPEFRTSRAIQASLGVNAGRSVGPAALKSERLIACGSANAAAMFAFWAR
jgi:hypothetical protein